MVRPDTVYLTAVSRTGIESEPAQYNFQPAPNASSLADSSAVVEREEWSDIKPAGYEANAIRMNLSYQDTLRFQDLTLIVEQLMRSASVPARLLKFDPGDENGDGYSESVSLKVYKNGVSELLHLNPGHSVNWYGFHISALGIDFQNTAADIEIATVGSLPVNRASMLEAGNGTMRLRVKHNLSKIALTQQVTEKENSAEPLPTAEYLQQLYKRNVETENRWDLPYHYYINSKGEIYEGRNVVYAGDVNADFDPRGYLMINLLIQNAQENITSDQLNSLKDFMNHLSKKHGIDKEELYLLKNPDSERSTNLSSDLKNSGHTFNEIILQ